MTEQVRRKRGNQRGFLVIEILISGLILTASIAATMYLFRVGIEHMERADSANILSAKLSQAVSLVKTLNLENGSGTEDMGEGVRLAWKANLLRKTRSVINTLEGPLPSPFEIALYRLSFSLACKGNIREYEINAIRFVRVESLESLQF